MKENQIPDFDLEDILQEFSEKPAAKAQPERPFTLEEAMAFDPPARKPVKKAKPEDPLL